MSDPGKRTPDKRNYAAAPQRMSGVRAVRPKDAASLVLIRKTRAGMEVLMGRRHKKTRFMPDAFVFPGGRLDAADARAKPATPLAHAVEAHLLRSATSARARALAMAAVRETYEETGLLLGAEGSVGGTRDAGWDAVRQTGMAPDLARLDYVGRAITRAASPIRFDARFFLAAADHFTGELGGSGELLDLAFLPLDQARELPSAMITQFMLSEVARLGEASAAQRAKRAEYRWRGGQRVVMYV
ncbi:MAG: NUDIX domain-containing protein [Alphaproteobacteria bacterium]|nr:NUDIX domain-containing protein [Alphaproteobacteria bacterium]